MDKLQLQKNCEAIAEELNKEESNTDMDLLTAKLLRINSLLALSAQCLMQAKKNLLYRQAEILKQHQGDKVQASVLMKLIQSECWEEAGTEVWIDRLNAGLTHAGEFIQTIISLRKTEMALTMQG